jgi:hypothetical protein
MTSGEPCTVATLADGARRHADLQVRASEKLFDRITAAAAPTAGTTLRDDIVDGDLGTSEEFADPPVVHLLTMTYDHGV